MKRLPGGVNCYRRALIFDIFGMVALQKPAFYALLGIYSLGRCR
jgi:hypothetical protein